MNTKQLTYPTIQEQQKFWINKEAVSDNATPETRNAILKSIDVLIQHSKETYPHFESIRGQQDISNAESSLKQLREMI